MKRKLFLTILCVLFGFQSFSQWTLLGPYVAKVSSIVPGDDRLFVAEQNGNVYSSVDSGLTWNYISRISMHSNYPVLYWDTYRQRLFAANDDLLEYSDDYGITWSMLSSYPSEIITGVAASGDTILVSTYPGGIQLTTDGGVNWTQANSGLLFNSAPKAEIKGQWMYLFGPGGTFRSPVINPYWTLLTLPPNNSPISTLEFHNTKLYAGYQYGIRVSTDSGTTWMPDTLLNGNNISLIATNGRDFYCMASGNTIVTSADSGRTSVLPTTLQPVSFNSLIHGQYVIDGADDGIYRSADLGNSWSYINNSVAGSSIADAVFVGNDLMLASPLFGCFVSPDSGITWTFRSNFDITQGAACLETFNDSVILGMNSGSLFLSPDHGITWSQIPSPTGKVNKIIVRDGEWFVATADGNFYWDVINTSWISRNIGINSPGMEVSNYFEMGGTLYCTQDQVYKTNNSGIYWNNVTGSSAYFGGTTYPTGLAGLGSEIFACTNDNGIFMADTNNYQWQTSGTDLDTLEFISIASHKGMLFASMADGGVIRSVDTGLTWQYYGLPNEISHFYSGGNRFYALTLTGVFLLDSSVTSVEENNAFANWIVYPTVSNGNIKLQIPDRNIISNIRVYDISGREIQVANANGQSSQELYLNVPAGEYFVRIGSKDSYVFRRIFVTGSR